MEKKITFRQAINKLPKKIRDLAWKNIKKQSSDEEYKILMKSRYRAGNWYQAICEAFYWSQSEEGYAFWQNTYNEIGGKVRKELR